MVRLAFEEGPVRRVRLAMIILPAALVSALQLSACDAGSAKTTSSAPAIEESNEASSSAAPAALDLVNAEPVRLGSVDYRFVGVETKDPDTPSVKMSWIGRSSVVVYASPGHNYVCVTFHGIDTNYPEPRVLSFDFGVSYVMSGDTRYEKFSGVSSGFQGDTTQIIEFELPTDLESADFFWEPPNESGDVYVAHLW